APRRPLVAIIGGAKVSTKIEVLRSLASKVDALILGGGIANTVIAATGAEVGRSLVERDMIDFAKRLLAGEFGKAEIPLPTDVVVGPGLEPDAKGRVTDLGGIGPDDMILDIGPSTAEAYAARLATAGTIVWNGPVGVFEHPEFAAGTRRVAEAVAASEAFSIVGGGDTLAAVEQLGIGDRISYISTGGGAFLEFLEGKRLPAVAVLEERAAARGELEAAVPGPDDGRVTAGRRRTRRIRVDFRGARRERALRRVSALWGPCIRIGGASSGARSNARCVRPILRQRSQPPFATSIARSRRSCSVPVRPQRRWPRLSRPNGKGRSGASSSRATGMGFSPARTRAASTSPKRRTRPRTARASRRGAG